MSETAEPQFTANEFGNEGRNRAGGQVNDIAYVEFDGVSKSYDGRTLVVGNINFSVRKGEFLTLLGPSGSGKTTCLMMLAGFEVPTSGAIRIDGRSVHALPPRKRGIGMVFQNYAIFPHMTVGRNLAFPLEVRGFDREQCRDRVARALQLVRLEGLADRRPAQLSGGQQQRVAIARALIFDPDLVLMDEPLGALDRRLREEMQYEIRRIHQSLGVTVVYVTHDQQEAMVMSDRIAVLRRGGHRADRRTGGPLRRAGEFVRRPFHRREQPPARPGDHGQRGHLYSGKRRSDHPGAARRALPARRRNHPVDSPGARCHRPRAGHVQ